MEGQNFLVFPSSYWVLDASSANLYLDSAQNGSTLSQEGLLLSIFPAADHAILLEKTSARAVFYWKRRHSGLLCGRKTFWKRRFSNTMTWRYSCGFIVKHKAKMSAFSNFSGAVWTEDRVKLPFSNLRGSLDGSKKSSGEIFIILVCIKYTKRYLWFSLSGN